MTEHAKHTTHKVEANTWVIGARTTSQMGGMAVSATGVTSTLGSLRSVTSTSSALNEYRDNEGDSTAPIAIETDLLSWTRARSYLIDAFCEGLPIENPASPHKISDYVWKQPHEYHMKQFDEPTQT